MMYTDFIKKTGLLLTVVLFIGKLTAQQHPIVEMPSLNNKVAKTVFAIIADRDTYQKAKSEIQAYKKILEEEGMATYIVANNWEKPEDVKKILTNLYKQKPGLEGAVFIGDIPVPMIRDAQHLTSTFKMDQRRDWQRSSVPSDRFYDDFDLQFTFIKQDSARKNYFYYSLNPESPQYISMNIYTGRIKPPVQEGVDKYEAIKKYLVKIVAEHKAKSKLDNMLVFTGQGYNSESLNSWAGEQVAIKEQFPRLFTPGNTIKFINFRMGENVKFTLLSEVQRNDLDMALYHHHGSPDEELINGYPYVSNPQQSIANVRRYLRSKIQATDERGKDVSKAKEDYEKSLGVPSAWMDDALIDSVKIADSVYSANLNININDVAGVKPNARFMILDACFNGSFHLDDYIAGHYIFGDGKTVAVMANTIGVLQDMWTDEMLGLLQYGVRIGQWQMQNAFLETHVIGDPTYSFSSDDKYGLSYAISHSSGDIETWKKLLQVNDADIQCLALSKLFDNDRKNISSLLKQTYFNSTYGVVRMEALKLLNRLNNNDYREVLKASCSDPYEFIRRQAAYYIGDSGSDELVPAIVQLAITDRHSRRVAARVRNNIDFMNADAVIAELNKQKSQSSYLVTEEDIIPVMLKAQQYAATKMDREIKTAIDKKNTLKERYSTVTMFRTYTFHGVIPQLITLAGDNSEELSLRLATIEALSWYTHSYQKPIIISFCNKLIADTSIDKDIRTQALKTKNILETWGA